VDDLYDFFPFVFFAAFFFLVGVRVDVMQRRSGSWQCTFPVLGAWKSKFITGRFPAPLLSSCFVFPGFYFCFICMSCFVFLGL
jgi:hypothetical protein